MAVRHAGNGHALLLVVGALTLYGFRVATAGQPPLGSNVLDA